MRSGLNVWCDTVHYQDDRIYRTAEIQSFNQDIIQLAIQIIILLIMLHVSCKVGQKILITTRVFNISSHVFECYTLYGARPYKEGTINSDHPVYGKK